MADQADERDPHRPHGRSSEARPAITSFFNIASLPRLTFSELNPGQRAVAEALSRGAFLHFGLLVSARHPAREERHREGALGEQLIDRGQGELRQNHVGESEPGCSDCHIL